MGVFQRKSSPPYHDRQRAKLHTCGLPYASYWVRRRNNPHTKLVEFLASVSPPGTPSDHQDATSATAASLHIGVASHHASEFTKRWSDCTLLCHGQFLSLRADCREVCLISQARCTTLDIVRRYTRASYPLHRPGFDGASCLTPSLWSSYIPCIHQGHPPTTNAAASATVRIASHRYTTRLIFVEQTKNQPCCIPM